MIWNAARSEGTAVADATGEFAGVDLDAGLVHDEARRIGNAGRDAQQLYYAQAWMVVHYLVNKNKMPRRALTLIWW